MSIKEKEKRVYPRVRKLYLISYINESKGRQTSPVSLGRTLDVSPMGVRVEIHQNIEPATSIEVEIGLNESKFSAQGKIIHAQEVSEGVHVIGIQFDRTQPKLADTNMGTGQLDYIDA